MPAGSAPPPSAVSASEAAPPAPRRDRSGTLAWDSPPILPATATPSSADTQTVAAPRPARATASLASRRLDAAPDIGNSTAPSPPARTPAAHSSRIPPSSRPPPPVLRLPAVVRLVADPVLAAQLLRRHACFPFLQHPNDLLLRESALPHGEFSSRLLYPRTHIATGPVFGEQVIFRLPFGPIIGIRNNEV